MHDRRRCRRIGVDGGIRMPTITTISREEAAPKSRRVLEPGVRKQRMAEFAEYVELAQQEWAFDPTRVVVFGEVPDPAIKFIVTLRAALKRAGIQADMRKVRSKPELHVWQVLAEEAPVVVKQSRQPRKAKPAEETERELVPA